jgi:hypothetical protein
MRHIFSVTPKVGALLLIFFSAPTPVVSATPPALSYSSVAFLTLLSPVSFIF